MRKAALLLLMVALAPQAAAARGGGIKMLNSVPEAYRGRWAPSTGACKDGDKAAIALSAKGYTGPLGKCEVATVSETAGPKGSIYSARLRCGDQAQQTTPANLVIRPDDANRISAGSTFESLKPYQRCSDNTPAAK